MTDLIYTHRIWAPSRIPRRLFFRFVFSSSLPDFHHFFGRYVADSSPPYIDVLQTSPIQIRTVFHWLLSELHSQASWLVIQGAWCSSNSLLLPEIFLPLPQGQRMAGWSLGFFSFLNPFYGLGVWSVRIFHSTQPTETTRIFGARCGSRSIDWDGGAISLVNRTGRLLPVDSHEHV